MTTFLLIRHGETDAVGKTIMGWQPGWHLNANGRRQAELLAARLARIPIRAIYASPLERAMQTAEPMALTHNLTVQPVDDLGEIRFGEWEGRSIAELDRLPDWQRFNSFRSGTQPPGGEFLFEVQARMLRR